MCALQLFQELRSDPIHPAVLLLDQSLSALSGAQIATVAVSDQRVGKQRPMPATPKIEPLAQELQLHAQASKDYGTAAWKRQRLGRQAARCQNTLGTEGDPTGGRSQKSSCTHTVQPQTGKAAFTSKPGICQVTFVAPEAFFHRIHFHHKLS